MPQALYDLENAPYGLIMEVQDLRGFVRAKAQLDRAKDGKDGPTGPIADRLMAAYKAIKEDRTRERLEDAADSR